jgi:hypothetical protein
MCFRKPLVVWRGEGLGDEIVVLRSFLQIVDSLSEGLDKDLARSEYKNHIRRNTDFLFKNDQERWEKVRDDILNKLFPDSVSTLPTVSERNSARRIVKQAVQLEIFRRSGKDGNLLGPRDQKIVDAVGKIFRATTLTLADGREAERPRLDPRKAATIKELLKIFATLETTFDPSMPVSTYKQLVVTKSNRVFERLNPPYQDMWKNGRSKLFLIIDDQARPAPAAPEAPPAAPEAKATSDEGNLCAQDEAPVSEVAPVAGNDWEGKTNAGQYRWLVRNPVRRGLELELARIEGLQAVKGPLSASSSGAGRTAGSNSKNGKRRSKFGCLDCLRFLLPIPTDRD